MSLGLSSTGSNFSAEFILLFPMYAFTPNIAKLRNFYSIGWNILQKLYWVVKHYPIGIVRNDFASADPNVD